MTYLQLLYQTRQNIDRLIEREENRKRTMQAEYQQLVAREQCTAARSCKSKLVPGYKMCSFHLHRAARNNDTYRRKRGYKRESTN